MKIRNDGLVLILVVTFFFQSSLVRAAGGVGNGGDPLSLEFESARQYAAQRVSGATDCAFGMNVSPEVRQWVLSNKDALSADILGTPYEWITDTQPTCGWTQSTPKASVTFSYSICRPEITDISKAVWMAIHESIHHFGFPDEAFPNAVADAVTALGLNSACPGTPASDPFDPASCPGTHLSADNLLQYIPLPENNQKQVGRFNISVRKRTCYSANWCAPWTTSNEDDPYGFMMDAMSSNPGVRSGGVTLELANNTPTVLISSDPGADHYTYDDQAWRATSTMQQYNLSSRPIALGWGGAAYYAGALGTQRALSFSGWITPGCLRETVAGSQPMKDNLGNTITVEYEAVLLSTIAP